MACTSPYKRNHYQTKLLFAWRQWKKWKRTRWKNLLRCELLLLLPLLPLSGLCVSYPREDAYVVICECPVINRSCFWLCMREFNMFTDSSIVAAHAPAVAVSCLVLPLIILYEKKSWLVTQQLCKNLKVHKRYVFLHIAFHLSWLTYMYCATSSEAVNHTGAFNLTFWWAFLIPRVQPKWTIVAIHAVHGTSLG